MTNLNYAYNSGAYNFKLGPSDFATFQSVVKGVINLDPSVQGQDAIIYTTLLNIINNPGSGTTGTLDPNVLAWLKGAVGVNKDTSSAGTFIRAYTVAGYQIRYGATPSVAQLNKSSNEIALNLAQTLINNGGLLPTIDGLGVIDAGFGAAANLFNVTPDPASGVYTPWAGTLLFPFIGDYSFYTNWLLNMQTVLGTVTNPATNAPVAATHRTRRWLGVVG